MSRRSRGSLLVALLLALAACGKVGPPVRADQRDNPPQTQDEEQKDEAAP